MLTGLHTCCSAVDESGPVVMWLCYFRKLWSDAACRAIPEKSGIAAVTMTVGSPFAAFVRYLFGRWLPTFEQLMHSKVSPYGSSQSLAIQHQPSSLSLHAQCLTPAIGSVPILSVLICRWPWPTLACLDS